ncbi:hypothetical protein [Novosphingobium mangrovi (ex Huang et al. 2023)]|uniref:Lipoprotein n=1 Tax=Novosphingobium mangrovi (ex Huang et al. 2023) TaxID=2976432 RepID=A0ABT2I887_9SPHN|nr:hypothetical protein [Novosphingobium mangrovi (ex Huang et al. 2023)]MCT2401040.1 hypothetical protein [Novosphingobium mangrovi (ex Huang et al. 2023)]
MLSAGMRNHALPFIAASLGLAGCAIIPSAAPPEAQPAPYQSQPTAPTKPPPQPEAPLAYAALGQTVIVDGPKVTPLAILEDSRCPMNARCVWAGQVRLRIRVDLGSGSRTMEITSGEPIQVADGKLDLVTVQPDKLAGRNGGTIEPASYRFGFRFMGGL